MEVKAQMGKVLLIVLCQLGVFPPISSAVPGGVRVNLWNMLNICGNTFPSKDGFEKKLNGQRCCFFSIFSIALQKTGKTIPFRLLYVQMICFYLFFFMKKEKL